MIFMDFAPTINILHVIYSFLKRAFWATVASAKALLNFASPQNPFGSEIRMDSIDFRKIAHQN